MLAVVLTFVTTFAICLMWFLFYGSPNRFQIHRILCIAIFLEAAVERGKRDGTIDDFGNLDVIARNRRFLTYQGFLQEDVEHVAKLMAARKGFQHGFVEFKKGCTVFRFKNLIS